MQIGKFSINVSCMSMFFTTMLGPPVLSFTWNNHYMLYYDIVFVQFILSFLTCGAFYFNFVQIWCAAFGVIKNEWIIKKG